MCALVEPMPTFPMIGMTPPQTSLSYPKLPSFHMQNIFRRILVIAQSAPASMPWGMPGCIRKQKSWRICVRMWWRRSLVANWSAKYGDKSAVEVTGELAFIPYRPVQWKVGSSNYGIRALKSSRRFFCELRLRNTPDVDYRHHLLLLPLLLLFSVFWQLNLFYVDSTSLQNGFTRHMSTSLTSFSASQTGHQKERSMRSLSTLIWTPHCPRRVQQTMLSPLV